MVNDLLKTVDDNEALRPAPLWARIAGAIVRHLPRGRSHFVRWLGRGPRGRFIAKMPRQLGGFQFDCSLRDMSSREVFFAGSFAPQEIALLRAVLKPGMTFVDVGANWGIFTMVAAQLVGACGNVIAIEADPRIAGKLRSNVERNRLAQVRVFERAIADREATLLLAGYDDTGENWGISRLTDEPGDADHTIFRVPSRQLDCLLDEAGLEAIDMVKIDVEGAEDLVLSGMSVGLQRQRYSRILLEFHPQQLAERGRRVDVLADILKRYGYHGYSLDYSPPAIRKMYYHPQLPIVEFILPLEEGLARGLRHTIWLKHNVPDLRDSNT